MKTTNVFWATTCAALLTAVIAGCGWLGDATTAAEKGDATTGDPAAADTTAAASASSAPVDKSSNGQIKPGDCPMWGLTTYRNNTPIAANPDAIPTVWDIGGFDRKTGEWQKDRAENIKWIAAVGSQTYGNPVVASKRLFVGTNNGNGYLKRYPRDIDLGCMLCFNEADGTFMWQHSSEKLPTGRVHDWPLQGVCCAPYVEGEKMWFVSSRGLVVCCDVQGFYDDVDNGEKAGLATLFEEMSPANIGPAVAALAEGKINEWLAATLAERGAALEDGATVKPGEKPNSFVIDGKIDGADRTLRVMQLGPKLVAAKQITIDDKHEADVIWSFDMMQKLGVSQHNMCACSVLALGDILFVNTSNGLDESHINLPAPAAPSFMAMDKNTGEVFWTDKSPGTNILHGQWSSPTIGVIQGEPQVIFGGGDGWVYAFKADKGADGKPTLLWKFDANPKTSKWVLGGRGTRNNIIATPVIYDGLVYVAVGQDPEHGEGVGHLWCIDPTKRGDVSPQLAMKLEAGERVVIPHKRLQAVIEEDGELAVDNPNSAVIWHYSGAEWNGRDGLQFEEEMHRSCGTVAIKDDVLYIADFSGLFHCLNAKTGKPYFTYDMLAAAWGSPMIVNDYVYIGDEDGDVCVFELGGANNEPLEEINMDNSVYSTPIVANNVLYIANKTHIFAIQNADAAE
ncbi:MAG: PQQ-binding-like beta-propeller repeat protein [Pirellulaceae bacterium]